jgi:tetratricopeptide (TPR) repeat protein
METEGAKQAGQAPAVDLRLELALLCDALDVTERGAFLFAVCQEEGPLRGRLVQHVREHLEAEGKRDLIEVALSSHEPDLAGQLERRLLHEPPREGKIPAPPASAAVREGAAPSLSSPQGGDLREGKSRPVVFVHAQEELADAGTDVASLPEDHPERARVEGIRRALRALNFQRERLTRLGVPLVFWLSQNALGQVTQHAADVFAARSGLFFLQTPAREPSAPPPMRAEATASLLDRFHRTLLPADELRRRASLYERRLGQERAREEPHWPRMAFLCQDLANIHGELDDYERAGKFQDEAIEAYHNAIAAREETGDKREERASLQVWLGLAYAGRIRGDRAENLERAIHHFTLALEVYTRQADPERWAATQNNLANAYRNRIRGDRAENLERAIHHYTLALEVYTRQAFPADWAMTQNNLANAYSDRVRGERAENLERAIHHYTLALEVRTRQAFPADWAMTQNNLALAYANRIRGERAENLERAIHHYTLALEVYTRQAFPADWAMTQNNLATAYAERIRGERAENLERAIHHYTLALEVRTRQADPEHWAMTHNNLGNAYAERIRGERAENLERAIQCYQESLKVLTAEAFPHYHRIVARNLEQALAERGESP